MRKAVDTLPNPLVSRSLFHMANQVKITIKKVKELKPDEKREWKRDYLSRKMARKTAHNDRVRENLTNLRRSLRKAWKLRTRPRPARP